MQWTFCQLAYILCRFGYVNTVWVFSTAAQILIIFLHFENFTWLQAETYKISQFGLREKNHIFTNQDFIRKQGKPVEKCRGNIEERNLLEKVICTHCLKTGKVCCIMLGTSWSGRINMLLFHVNLPNLIGLAERSLSIFLFLTKTWNAKTKKY